MHAMLLSLAGLLGFGPNDGTNTSADSGCPEPVRASTLGKERSILLSLVDTTRVGVDPASGDTLLLRNFLVAFDSRSEFLPVEAEIEAAGACLVVELTKGFVLVHARVDDLASAKAKLVQLRKLSHVWHAVIMTTGDRNKAKLPDVRDN